MIGCIIICYLVYKITKWWTSLEGDFPIDLK